MALSNTLHTRHCQLFFDRIINLRGWGGDVVYIVCKQDGIRLITTFEYILVGKVLDMSQTCHKVGQMLETLDSDVEVSSTK